MSISARNPYEDPESSTAKWVLLFVLLSVLAHIVIVGTILLVSRYVPAPKLDVPEPANPTISVTLTPPPPPRPLQPRTPRPSLFLPTHPDPNAKPNQDTPIESDNDNRLKSESQKPRKSETPLPEVTGRKNHLLDLENTPLVQSTPKPEVASTPPTPKPERQRPAPPQPRPERAQTKPSPPHPPQPTPHPPEPARPKPPTPQVAKNKVDPDTGLPVLPPIVAPTIEPQTAVTPSLRAPNASAGRPPPSFEVNKSDIAGSAGVLGANAAETKATPWGRYKAKVYRAVGSRWYAKVGPAQGLLPVGIVRVQFTITADGMVTTKVLDGGNSTMQMLLSISVNAIREAAPFDNFDDYPGMRQELIKANGGDGSSYTDDFTFSVY